ncbi:DegV family protein [Paenibacillus marinisediminis]
MANVRIVTDSTADIPLEVRQQLGIEMVPLKVHFGNEMYQDAVTIEPDQFFEKLVQSSKLPTTSQPSPVEFLNVYRRLIDEQDSSVISIHLSAALSGTYQSAVLAKNMMEEDADITVIDSRSASYGIGMIVVQAAKMAQEGCSKEQIMEMIDRISSGRQLFFLVDSLEYLQKGGRIGKAAAVFGSLLNIKPILSVDAEGGVHALDKVRGSKKAIARIVEMMKQKHGDNPVHFAVGYTNDKAATEDLVAAVQQAFDIKDVQYIQVGAVIGTHVGLGVSAAFMWPAIETSELGQNGKH